jgi:hypothetical protein
VNGDAGDGGERLASDRETLRLAIVSRSFSTAPARPARPSATSAAERRAGTSSAASMRGTSAGCGVAAQAEHRKREGGVGRALLDSGRVLDERLHAEGWGTV